MQVLTFGDNKKCVMWRDNKGYHYICVKTEWKQELLSWAGARNDGFCLEPVIDARTNSGNVFRIVFRKQLGDTYFSPLMLNYFL
jgi:hypothetical protein